MKRIALVGAGGFVGTRLIERGWLGGDFEPVPIVRNPKGFVRLSKYGRPCVYADAGESEGLKRAFDRCDGVVNLTMGDDERFSADALSILRACEGVGVPTFVHVSSAEIFGRAEDPNLTDDSPPPKHWMPYARSKAAAEAVLREASGSSPVRVVTIRPGLIWGPRSPWVAGPVSEMLDGSCVLFGGGSGIANLIHVDNLVEIFIRVVTDSAMATGFYNVADRECVRWRGYFEALASEAGISRPEFHELPFEAYREGMGQRVLKVKDLKMLRRIKRAMPSQSKWHLRAALQKWGAMLGGHRSDDDSKNRPKVTKSMWWLQGTRNKLPTTKIDRALPGLQLISFDEGMRRTAGWMRFAGFHL